MWSLSDSFQISAELSLKLIASAAVLFFLSLGRFLVNLIVKRRVTDMKRLYGLRRTVLYVYTLLIVILLALIWLKEFGSLTTFLGLASAGLAIAMHDTIANIAGWVFILSRKPFEVGDRIQIGESAGDVIDIRFFQFSIVEIGNWVDADQSTGRIIHLPNSKVLREPLANYQTGFNYIWNEIPVLITFESDWKKAKVILGNIAHDNAEHLSNGAQAQIRKAAERFMIFFDKLTPIVYTSVKDSGVLLTIRYLINPRQRRTTEQQIWEAVLDAFAEEKNIELAYPTTRFYGGFSSTKE